MLLDENSNSNSNFSSSEAGNMYSPRANRGHKDRSLKFKLQVLEELSNGARAKELCNKHKLSPSTLSTWKKNRQNYEAQSAKGFCPKAKRHKETKASCVEAALVQWLHYKQKFTPGLPISGDMMRQQANRYVDFDSFDHIVNTM